MSAIVTIALLVVTVAALMYGAVHVFVRALLQYRLRMRLLRQLEAHPEWLQSDEAVKSALESSLTVLPNDARHNYALTGGSLVVFGTGCMTYGYMVRVGQVAVGLYTGGQICIALGLILVLLGLLSRFLTKARHSSSILP